jgi:type II secretory pathway predicted ATPase ExeA
MYTEFYGLKEKPFNLTPSPRFVYMSEGHREAMALLTYGVTERKGFILLTGEVGTGKTTMIHSLINNLDSSVEYVYIVNPLLTSQEFIDYLAFSSFKKRIHFKSKADFLLEFEDFLRTCFQHQKIFILIIDEAHKLSFELLEEIRLLSNMEFAEEKLINIFLVGQPELNDNLNSPKGRATLQRIGIRYDIPPLGLKETGEYIETRLMVAGALKKGEIFQKDAIEAIHRLSQGYPRTINILADNALLLGYSRDKKFITSSMIDESYNAMKLEGSFLEDSLQQKPPEKAKAVSHVRFRGSFRWIVVSFVIIMLTALILFMVKTSRISIPDVFTFMHKEKSQDTAPVNPPVMNDQIEIHNEGSGDHLQDAEWTVDNIPDDIHQNQQIELTNLQILTFEKNTGFSKSVIAKEGDTFIRLAEKAYGYVGEEELDLLKRYNPEIKNINQIEIGQKISFPVYTILISSHESHEKAENLYQQLKMDGYDANIISPETDDRAPSFLVTVGAFINKKEAESFASTSLEGRHYKLSRE